MKDLSRTKQELIEEISILTKKIKKLEKSESRQGAIKLELCEIKNKYYNLADDMPALVCTFLPDSTLTYINKAYCKLFQKNPDELIGKKFLNFLPDEATREHVKNQYMSLTPENPTRTYEHKVIIADETNQYHWQRWTDRAFFSKNGQISYFQSIGEDITEHKHTENELQQSESELAIMNKIAQQFLTIPDEEMYGMVLDIVREVLESPQGLFGYISEAGDLVIPSLTREVLHECKMQDKTIIFPPDKWGDSLWGHAICDRRSYRANRNFKVPDGHIPVTSFLAVPLIFQGQAVGLLAVANRKDGYSKEHQQLLENIASFVSPILNARKQRDHQERECIVAEEARKQAESNHKQAEDSLKRSEYLYRAIFDNTGVANVLVHEDTTMILVNSEFEELSGYSKEEIESKKSWREFFVEEDVNRMMQYHRLRRTDNDAVPRKYECRLKDRHGNVKDIAISVDMMPSTKESIASLHDITERKQAERTLQESQQRLAGIIEFLPDATVVINKEGKVIAWNQAMEAMTGIKKETMLGKGNYEYAFPFYGERKPVLVDFALHPDKKKMTQYADLQDLGKIISAEAFIPSLGNIHVYATASVIRDSKGEVIAAIECVRDITERKKLAERLNRAEKMEALGALAGGVAHDLNNVLGVLVGYSELLAESLPEGSFTRKYADNIQKSSVKGAAIIQDLLTLARRGVNVSEVVDINKLVFDYLKSPEFEKLKSYHPNVKIKTELEGRLLNVKGSPTHLGKTIMNLVSNAAEAISDQGEVIVLTENRYLDHPIRGYDTIQEGDYAVLTVSDTGGGISAHDLGKIFEPFYTKKVMGRSGTGLGLAVVWGTVKDHNGYIDVQSEENKGTIFTLYFPVTRENIEIVNKTLSLDYYMSKGESVLVVDDVKEQRELAMNMLERLGYQVKAVASGEEAIKYIKHEKVDLIVLDMIMDPGIDGLETYRRILKINPRQKAIIMSGFSETDRVRKAQRLGAGAYVKKPYLMEKIGMAVRMELNK